MSELCDICGVGEYLPSRVCDHCDSKADDHPATPRPIESAPKDGAFILLFSGGEWNVGRWNRFKENWLDAYNYELFPSHWLPVPPSPNP